MPQTIVVGYVSRTFFNMPMWIATEHGYFAEEGIEVTTTMLGNASQVPPLLDGTLHLVIGSPELAVHNAAEGGPLRIYAGNAGKLVHSLIARAPFKRIEDLRGGTIGILSLKEGTFFHIRKMLEAHGLRYPGDYTTRDTGGVPPRHKALMEGTIDAGLQSVPWNFVAEDEGMNNLGDVIDYVPDWQFVSVNANREWVQANRPAMVGFLRAILRGTAWLYGNREGAAEIAARELPAPIDQARRAWDHFTSTDALTRDIRVNEKGLAQVIETLIEAGQLSPQAPREPAFYIDDTCLEEARRR